jgi:hypothetical protein
MVVSTEGKGLGRTKSGDWQEEDRKGTTDDVSTALPDGSHRLVHPLAQSGHKVHGVGTKMGTDLLEPPAGIEPATC